MRDDLQDLEKEPSRSSFDPLHQMPGPNIQPVRPGAWRRKALAPAVSSAVAATKLVKATSPFAAAIAADERPYVIYRRHRSVRPIARSSFHGAWTAQRLGLGDVHDGRG